MSPIFLDIMFHMDIHVPLLQSHVCYQFQSFTALSLEMELICTNGKHDLGTKFISPVFTLQFTLTCLPTKVVNNHCIPQQRRK